MLFIFGETYGKGCDFIFFLKLCTEGTRCWKMTKCTDVIIKRTKDGRGGPSHRAQPCENVKTLSCWTLTGVKKDKSDPWILKMWVKWNDLSFQWNDMVLAQWREREVLQPRQALWLTTHALTAEAGADRASQGSIACDHGDWLVTYLPAPTELQRCQRKLPHLLKTCETIPKCSNTPKPCIGDYFLPAIHNQRCWGWRDSSVDVAPRMGTWVQTPAPTSKLGNCMHISNPSDDWTPKACHPNCERLGIELTGLTSPWGFIYN